MVQTWIVCAKPPTVSLRGDSDLEARTKRGIRRFSGGAEEPDASCLGMTTKRTPVHKFSTKSAYRFNAVNRAISSCGLRACPLRAGGCTVCARRVSQSVAASSGLFLTPVAESARSRPAPRSPPARWSLQDAQPRSQRHAPAERGHGSLAGGRWALQRLPCE